jgi:ubiquinone/menaquinone biosynthesis C-methylase UbiE
MSRNSGVVHWAARYDLLVWLMVFGRERRFREKLLEPARLQTGESVLDVGCGTGSLAMVAKRRVGPTGTVAGIDASKEMIARAKRKAEKARLDIAFEIASADSLPVRDASFDVALCTVTLHHLPRSIRTGAVREMGRVLRPGGRMLLVDFSFKRHRTLAGHLHRHSAVKPNELLAITGDAGMDVVESGSLGMWDLHFVLAQP